MPRTITAVLLVCLACLAAAPLAPATGGTVVELAPAKTRVGIARVNLQVSDLRLESIDRIVGTYEIRIPMAPWRNDRGAISLHAPESLDRLTRVVDALDGATQYAYDAAGNLVSETDTRGQTTSYTYDQSNALLTITDALLGTIADGDIGTHFPPSDERWRGASSDIFLKAAADKVRQAGGEIVHMDVTLLCEAPRIGSHRDKMRTRIAEIVGTDVSQVSIKATTNEGLGFVGRNEGIAAMATATVRLP